jgi:hypothetical protein
MATRRHKVRAGRGLRFCAVLCNRTGKGSHTTLIPFGGRQACRHRCRCCSLISVIFAALLGLVESHVLLFTRPGLNCADDKMALLLTPYERE